MSNLTKIWEKMIDNTKWSNENEEIIDWILKCIWENLAKIIEFSYL